MRENDRKIFGVIWLVCLAAQTPTWKFSQGRYECLVVGFRLSDQDLPLYCSIISLYLSRIIVKHGPSLRCNT